MILYANGGGHTAAAEAVNAFSFAGQDQRHQHLAMRPHPDNLNVSYGNVLANLLKMSFVTDAEHGCMNVRVVETTLKWIKEKSEVMPTSDMFVIIQWCDWGPDLDVIYTAIKDFHLLLEKLGVKHVFFNGKDSFMEIPEEDRYDFGASYISPYLPEHSFDGWLQGNGYSPVITSNEFYGPEAHAAWARFLAKHIADNKMV